jgi:hypothetical protein
VLAHVHPTPCQFAPGLVPASRCDHSRLSVRGSTWNRQVPRAPLPSPGVTRASVASSATSEDVTPLSSLIRTHAPEDGPSRRYLCGSFPGCLDLSRGGPRGARGRFFPPGFGLPRALPTGRQPTTTLLQTTSCRSPFRGLSSFLTFRPPGLLATQVVPTVADPVRKAAVELSSERGDSHPARSAAFWAAPRAGGAPGWARVHIPSIGLTYRIPPA